MMQEPKISKLKGGYSSSTGLIFQSWLKEIHVHIEDRRLTQREAIQLVKEFTMEHAWDEVEFYMGMVANEDQSFEGLIGHLHDTFQSGETIGELISDFYGQSQKTRETKVPFADDLQVLARKIIVQKPSFQKEVNQQLKLNMHINCRINTMLHWHTVHCSPPKRRNHSQNFGDD